MIIESYMEKMKRFFFENSVITITRAAPILIQKGARSIFFGLLFFSALFFLNHLLMVNPAFAFPTLGQSIQQFQKSLESSINKEIQSIHEVTDNITNCSDDTSLQAPANNTKNSSVYSYSSCSDNYGFPTISTNIPIKTDLSGTITSAEYNMHTGKIVSSVFGNWSLKPDTGNQIDFKAYFKKQPLIINLTNQPSLNNPQINNNTNLSASSSKNHSNTGNNEQYNFSNFRVNAIMQQNLDTTYKGLIDATENNMSSNSPNQTYSYNNLNVSISVLNGKVLVISFENENIFSNEFRNIPLVGLVR